MTNAMLDSENQPRPELYGADGYHLSKEGYAIWRDVLKPILLKNELSFEPKKEEGKLQDPKSEDPQKITPLKPKIK
jgi:hypothetical protein